VRDQEVRRRRAERLLQGRERRGRCVRSEEGPQQDVVGHAGLHRGDVARTVRLALHDHGSLEGGSSSSSSGRREWRLSSGGPPRRTCTRGSGGGSRPRARLGGVHDLGAHVDGHDVVEGHAGTVSDAADLLEVRRSEVLDRRYEPARFLGDPRPVPLRVVREHAGVRSDAALHPVRPSCPYWRPRSRISPRRGNIRVLPSCGSQWRQETVRRRRPAGRAGDVRGAVAQRIEARQATSSASPRRQGTPCSRWARGLRVVGEAQHGRADHTGAHGVDPRRARPTRRRAVGSSTRRPLLAAYWTAGSRRSPPRSPRGQRTRSGRAVDTMAHASARGTIPAC
jgi:hypothetical protein